MGRTYQKLVNLLQHQNLFICSFTTLSLLQNTAIIVAHHFLWIQAESYYWELQMMRGCRGKLERLGYWKVHGESTCQGGWALAPIQVTSPTQPLMIPQPQEKAATINLLTGQFRYWYFLIVLFGSSYFRGRTNYSLCRSMGRVAGIYLFKLCRSFNTLLT